MKSKETIKKGCFIFALSLSFILAADNHASAATGDDWIDPVTGHRIVRLSRVSGGSSKFYYHQNPFTSDGDKMIFANAHDGVRYLYSVDLTTFATRQIIASTASTSMDVVAPTRNEIISVLSDNRTVVAINIDTSAQRTIGELPVEGRGITVNEDETLLAGVINEGLAKTQEDYPSSWISEYFNLFNPENTDRPRNTLFTMNLDTGEIQNIYETDLYWLDHAQFSPTDSNILMFDHQGGGGVITDSPWIIDITPGQRTPICLHTKSDHDFVAHEFWDPSGNSAWYDFDPLIDPSVYPGPRHFYIAKTNINTHVNTLYPIASEDWSLHYNINSDGSLIAGDGSYNTVNHGQTLGTKHIVLYRLMPNNTVQIEPLADMSGNNYNTIEPNVQFTPDSKWVVYRSNQITDSNPTGLAQVYMVAIDNVAPAAPTSLAVH